MSNDRYWLGDAEYSDRERECERAECAPVLTQTDWQTREWAVLEQTARAKGMVIVACTCGHHEMWDAGHEPCRSAPCTKCMLVGRMAS